MAREIRSLCLAFFLAALPATAGAEARLEQLSARLGQARVLQAQFSQTKTLQALKRPLKISGRLVFVHDKGVLWRIEKPYQASYLLGRDNVVEIAADGSRRSRAVRDVPALAQMGNVFQAIFQGDLQVLETHFNVHSEVNPASFRIDLSPKPALAHFLKGITAKGGEFLESIDIEEASGDRTRIEFRDTRLDSPLSDADRSLF